MKTCPHGITPRRLLTDSVDDERLGTTECECCHRHVYEPATERRCRDCVQPKGKTR